MAKTNGPLNAINIETDQLENIYLEGEGAGGIPTASSVLSDIYEISHNCEYTSLGFLNNKLLKYEKFNSSNLESKFYLRIIAKDQSGVLSKITSYFNESNISIEKMLQIPDNESKGIPIVITTHKIKTSDLFKSVKKIEELDFILEKISLIPIEY